MASQLKQKLQTKLNNYSNPSSNSGINTVNLDPITYNSRYPWFDEANYRKLESKANNLWLTGYQKEQFMDNLYQQVLPKVQDDIKNSDRRKYINDASYEVSQIQDKDAKIQAKGKLTVTELSQKLKEKYNIDPTINDEQLFNDWIKSIPNWEKLLVNYLNNWDRELLYKGKLEESPKESLWWWDVWDNIKTKANVPIDTMKKWWQRTFDKMWAMMYKNILQNKLGDAFQWKDMEDYVNIFSENIIEPRLQENALNYQQNINERYKNLEQKNLDQNIKGYYDNKWYTELLSEWDFKWFAYKSLWDAAQNREMPVVVAASVVQPEIWLALMATDTYARENQEAFENMLNNWATYEQAENWAVVVWLINSAVEVWLEKLIGWVETWASDAIRKTFMKNVQEEAAKKWLGRILVEWAGMQLKASWEEWLEEIVQQIVQNAAVRTVNENQELFEWVWQAFEWGFYNPMNLLAWGGNLTQNISQNTDTINQQLWDTAYNAGVATRTAVDSIADAWAFMRDKATAMKDMAKQRLNRKNWQNVTTENVETETTEKTEKPWVIDRITDWWAEKITNTVSAQDKLYKAQEPRMNTLSKKKDLEKRREHSDRANQLIVQNGYIPTNTSERLEAHETTMKNIWKQVEDKINWWQEIMVDLSQIADVLDEYIQSQRDTKSTLTEWDLAKLEKESQALRGQQVSLPVAERLKQLYNAVINNRWEEKASDTMANWLQKATHEIWVIEDNLLSEIPWEFQWLKNDFGALKDTYEDVFKADMKNQRKKWSWLTETYSRIEWIWDIANWLLGVATWKWDLASIWKWAAKFLVWKSLAKASDVDFLIEQWFKELAKQYGNNWNVTTNTTPTPTAPTTRTTTEVTEDIDVWENPTDLTATEEVVDQEVTTTPKKKTTKKKTSKKGLDENQASSKTAAVENATVETEDWEVVSETEIETLPADVSVQKEAKQVWEKRIAPDRVPRQQLTFDEWVNKINDNLNTVAEYMKLRSEFYTAGNYNDSEMKHRLNTLEKEVQQILYWENWFNFQSTRSKEFDDLWKNITDNKNNPVSLREVARNFYISKVKKDISKWYKFPIAVLEKIPWAQKALNARERYQKWLDTSFSAKDARIDYSEQDKIWAWIKSQDWKQVTKEQKEDIVKWIEDFGKTLWLDMKKFAEDRWLVYVHLHGWHPFLSTFWWMYREATNNQWEKNISVSVWGSENVRYKDPKTKEWKTNKLNTTMSHELGHAMDYLIDNRLFTWEQKSMLRSKYNPVNRLREYYAKWNEIVARAIEQYVAVENWQPNYYLENWNLDAGEFKWTDLEYALKEVWSYYERPWYWSKLDYEKYVKPYVEEAFKNNFEEYKTAKK